MLAARSGHPGLLRRLALSRHRGISLNLRDTMPSTRRKSAPIPVDKVDKKNAPLLDDIRLLGRLLGEVIR